MIFMLGLHPGPGLLLHGQPDDRPRHPRLEPGQLLPARRTRPCRARRRSAPSCRGSRRPPSSPCRRRGPTARSSRPGRSSSTSAGPTGRRPPTRRSSSKVSGAGNFDKWTEGPKLPAPRANAATIYSGGKIYVDRRRRRGRQADRHGLRPGARRDDRRARQLADVGRREARPEAARSRCPAPWSWPAPTGCSSSAAPTARGPSTRSTSRRSTRPARRRSGPRSRRSCSRRSPTPRPRSSAASSGSTAGRWPTGRRPATVQRGEFGTADKATTLVQFGVRAGSINLPAPRTNIDGFAANGNLYAVGGSDGTTPQRTLYWGVPTSDGDIPEWKHLDVSDLPPEGNAGGAPLILGPDAIIIGGTTTSGVSAGAVRANIAPPRRRSSSSACSGRPSRR